MKRFWVLKGLKMLTFAACAVALLGWIVMSLWNAVLPAVTGFHTISFVQALGLLVLSRILFGGLRGTVVRWPALASAHAGALAADDARGTRAVSERIEFRT